MKTTNQPAKSAPKLILLPTHLGRNGELEDERSDPVQQRQACQDAFVELLDHVGELGVADKPMSFTDVERDLHRRLRRIGALLVVLFLTLVDRTLSERLGPSFERHGRTCHRGSARARNFQCVFGVVRYWRTYYRAATTSIKLRRGHYPSDEILGLGRERVSMGVLSVAVYLATKMSFASTRDTMARMFGMASGQVPSTEVIGRAVLGLGAQSQDFFEQLGGFDDDGDVLIIQLDGKGIPTASERELKRRRGKRKPNNNPGSARHRGRRRRKKWLKSPLHPEPGTSGFEKNAKMGTLLVAYTLRTAGEGVLEGPFNKRVWVSMSPKKHMVDMAVLEAKRRGFDPTSPEVRIQVITDGDPDLERHLLKAFPHAIRSIDIMHVLEYIWAAGRAFHPKARTDKKEYSALRKWVSRQKKRLLKGRVDLIIDELEHESSRARGAKKTTLTKTLNYISKRVDWLDYASLLKEDLELGTGAVEGAVKYVMCKRFDQGGMRWIVERAEALLTLRCIAVNGDWDEFIAFVERRRKAANERNEPIPLLLNNPVPLPHKAA